MQQIARSNFLAFHHLPRPYCVKLGSLTIVILAIAIWQPYIYTQVVMKLFSCFIPLKNHPLYQLAPENNEPIEQTILNKQFAVKSGLHEYVVSDGDTFSNINNSFKENISIISGKCHHMTLNGELNGSFVASARAAGLTSSDINAVIKALQWQIDFRKLRKGDKFAVVISRKILDDQSMQSCLLGVRLKTRGKDYYAFRSSNGKFYSRDAISLTHDFMRFPTIKPFRVSSNFNLRRINPITGRIIPHRGVDFAMPIGTPVLVVGDGEVVVSKNSGTAGNYVAVRHSPQYMTCYMHLKKLLVKPGQKVKRGDRIALSGNTGRSTGPHLHFEVWINQQAVNPLTANLPCTDRLVGWERTEYLKQVDKMLPQLQFK